MKTIKERAVEMLRRFSQANPRTLAADNAAVDMAALLQELIDAPEPEPVGEAVNFNGWGIVIWKGMESDFQVGTKFYAIPPANNQSEQHRAIALILQGKQPEQPASVQDGLHMLISGAVYDFAGFLTTQEESLAVGATENASTVVDLLKSWANKRGLKLKEASVLSWQDVIIAPAAPAAPEQPTAVPVLTVECEPDYWSRGHYHEGTKPYIAPTAVWKLPIGTKLYTAPPAPSVPDADLVRETERWLSQRDLELLVTFGMQADDCDADGHTLSKEQTRRLCELGVLRNVGFGRSEMTSFGCVLFDQHWEQSRSLPLRTHAEYAALAAEKGGAA